MFRAIFGWRSGYRRILRVERPAAQHHRSCIMGDHELDHAARRSTTQQLVCSGAGALEAAER